MVPMARILVVGVVFIAAPCAFAELKPARQPISANAAAETNFMLSPLCVSLRRPFAGREARRYEAFIEGVLARGIPPEAVLIVEWTTKARRLRRVVEAGPG